MNQINLNSKSLYNRHRNPDFFFFELKTNEFKQIITFSSNNSLSN